MSSEAAAGKRAELITEYRKHESDTGSPEVQIALLTDRLNRLAEHFKSHPQDKHSQRGLLGIVSRRKGLLEYLRRESPERYRTLIGSLGLRK